MGRLREKVLVVRGLSMEGETVGVGVGVDGKRKYEFNAEIL